MSNFYILNLANLDKSDLSKLELGHEDISVFTGQNELLKVLKNESDCKVFIINNVINDSFIIRVSEEKLFTHSYFLFTNFKMDSNQKALSYSLGYNNIFELPLTPEDKSLLCEDLFPKKQAA
jgi:hypothetical protein